MTKTLAYALGLSALASTAAFADMASVDANADGMVTMEEAQAAYPDMTADQFSQIDANGDGAIDDSEMTEAQETGLLPAG